MMTRRNDPREDGPVHEKSEPWCLTSFPSLASGGGRGWAMCSGPSMFRAGIRLLVCRRLIAGARSSRSVDASTAIALRAWTRSAGRPSTIHPIAALHPASITTRARALRAVCSLCAYSTLRRPRHHREFASLVVARDRLLRHHYRALAHAFLDHGAHVHAGNRSP